MKNIAFIWDLDGTLIDSYGAILATLETMYDYYGWPFDQELLTHYVLEYSVGQLLDELARKYDLSAMDLKSYYSADLKTRDDELKLFEETLPVLKWTKEKGIINFIYTHKGATTDYVLEKLGIASYFEEVLNSTSGFARKPNPEAIIYLVDKYNLDKSKTYYIGDRPLDRDCALAAGIFSINLALPDSLGNTKITSLLDILDLPIF